MAANVYMFNASLTLLNVSINGGNPLTISGAAASSGWQPAPAPKPIPFTAGLPSAGSFGIGSNSCEITPTRGSITNTATIVINDSTPPNTPLQLYFYYVDDSNVSWILLDNGQCINGSLQFSSDSQP
ncbi:hypothetical protein [Azospirillum sp. B2RO_4]|uniref:hypothetical protein n=1 Tax=Azospirillum sp. B2RO_4 TaxID=3027796 RepID=UPI003DA7F72F